MRTDEHDILLKLSLINVDRKKNTHVKDPHDSMH
jgi:hypothetical protein